MLRTRYVPLAALLPLDALVSVSIIALALGILLGGLSLTIDKTRNVEPLMLVGQARISLMEEYAMRGDLSAIHAISSDDSRTGRTAGVHYANQGAVELVTEQFPGREGVSTLPFRFAQSSGATPWVTSFLCGDHEPPPGWNAAAAPTTQWPKNHLMAICRNLPEY